MVPLLATESIDFNDAKSDAKSNARSPGDDRWSGPSSETITRWLAEASQLHRAAASSPEFYADAARFVVETVGLDAAWVLSRADDQWHPVGSCLPDLDYDTSWSHTALSAYSRTPMEASSGRESLNLQTALGRALKQLEQQSVAWYQPTAEEGQAIVVAPVLDTNQKLIAAVYGVRNTQHKNRRRGIRPLEARLVQLLADSVAVGIARIDQEIEAARTRVLLEQAFSPHVADYLQQHPESLSGKLSEVSLLFADLRGYTTLAETMSPSDCYELLGEVMEALTTIVIRHGGVVVDYYGDGLLALWNAPIQQPNHPDLACAAALQLFEAMPAISRKWQSRVNGPLELGIGVHTGPAHVGNAGTRSRMKYGPRGNTVNVASRVQAASKQLQLPLVITAATQTKLSDKFFNLRTCTAKLPGLEQPIELYTVYPASEARRIKSRLDQYARALEFFETGDLEAAECLLRELVKSGHATPARFLAHYTAAQINGNQGRRAVDRYAPGQGPVIEILGK
ncbi:MAG: adenylate/guanylate cyclase domain-containing protein [Planctomycetes bacterium]|nr:adenylate/guanylate cyclase domain-containing protein [Planctomycetota bacterium]